MKKIISLFIIFLLFFSMIPASAVASDISVIELPYISEGSQIYNDVFLNRNTIYTCDINNYITASGHGFYFNKTDDDKSVNLSTQYVNISYKQNVTWSWLIFFKYDWDLTINYYNESGYQTENYNGSDSCLFGKYGLAINMKENIIKVSHGASSNYYYLNDTVVYPSSYLHIVSDVEMYESNVLYEHEEEFKETFYLSQLNAIFRTLYGIISIFIKDRESRYFILEFLIFFSKVFSLITFILKYMILSPIYLFITFEGCAMLFSTATSRGNFMRNLKTLLSLNYSMMKLISAFFYKLFTLMYNLLDALKFWS